MKNILLVLGLLFSGNIVAQSNFKPIEFMKYYVQIFNEKNLTAYKNCFHFPNALIVDGQVKYNAEDKIPAVFFENMKKAGWAYSKVNKLQLIFEDQTTAVVLMDYSRFDKNDKPYFTTQGIYTLSNEKGYWQIIGMSTKNPVANH